MRIVIVIFLSSISKCRPYFGIYLHMLLSLFSWFSLSVSKKMHEVRNRLIWRRRKQITASSDWLVTRCYLPEGRTENPQCPVNWKRHDSCAGYLIFEQDLNSFYETGELNLAVDCKGNALTWEIEFDFHIITSFAVRQRSRRDTFNRKKPEDEKKNSYN